MDELRFGAHVALRSSQLCAVWRHEPRPDPALCVGEKAFLTYSIGYHLKGGWRFHGKKPPLVVDPLTVIVGVPGQHYGCQHVSRDCETVCAISLLPGALDESDGMIFDRQVLTGVTLPPLNRSLSIEDDDQFESFIFDVFDYVSQASLRDTHALDRTALRGQRMKRFIERHAFEAISLGDIASCVGVSPFTCIRQFKRSVGTTPLRYLSRVRLDRAKALLKNRRFTVGDVARRVGIRDRHYFTRWFTKETGVSPQAFRSAS